MIHRQPSATLAARASIPANAWDVEVDSILLWVSYRHRFTIKFACGPRFEILIVPVLAHSIPMYFDMVVHNLVSVTIVHTPLLKKQLRRLSLYPLDANTMACCCVPLNISVVPVHKFICDMPAAQEQDMQNVHSGNGNVQRLRRHALCPVDD